MNASWLPAAPNWLLELSPHCMNASWLPAATKTRARDPNIPLKDFTPNALPAVTLPIYLGLGLAHSMLDCIFSDLLHI